MENLISGKTRLAGVIANPIKHSLSPMIHNTAYKVLNFDAVYLAFEVEQVEFEHAMNAVKTLDMMGINISMPYKKDAYDLCDELTERAKLIGVVNTVVNRNNKLLGDNTDGLGFIGSLKDYGVSVKGKVLTILGAGGAAKAAICQSALEGAKEIHVFKRQNETFESVKRDLEKIAIETNVKIMVHGYHDKKAIEFALKESTLIVNSTQLGMGNNNDLPLDEMGLIKESHVVVDLIYHPLETPFLKQAKKSKALTINGLGMLVHQAAYAFKLMTGETMPVDKVIEKLKIELVREKEL
ncbi:shikimate dehydrogenase [Vagococcus carniphilus]|uniref:Shikimate dehydrogenase (NADP(+)) n=1 Tax=Vagococcus carniphilus TaxID=218144 RepID=A0AAW8UCS0_9ENTE|nr:shikimate dehydrogenase [Vagococcus carniphilus]MDT2835022.1 shikimate dehydrogenase [Vagococcus carniphilus]MDT2864622.1 shikimate dehydrogenase [Vagococcus carniphilus]